jgi:glucose-1-phosphate adenylyltransferase
MINVVALVLAGGNMGDYGVLTQNRAKGALTFAGTFRIIDFALSNLVNAGINKIGLIIQYLPGSLIEHVESGHPWDLDNYGKRLKIMPPFVGLAETIWYNGTADALLQNMHFVRDQNADHVVILSGEHAFYVDFRDVLESHISRGSDLTVITKELLPEQKKRRFGYVTVDESGRITQYDEKPDEPTSNLAATGIYVFKASVLADLLTRNKSDHEKNLARDIIQPHCQELLTHEYRMTSCWEYMETVRDYYDLHMRLMEKGGIEIIREWNIMTNLKFRCVGHAPAAKFGHDATVIESMVSPACEVEGTVINCVLSPGVKIGKGAVISNSILYHDCVVGADAVLDHVISDRDAVFGEGCILGQMDENETPPPSGQVHPLTLIGKAAHIGDGVVIPPGRQVRPGKILSTQEAANLEA